MNQKELGKRNQALEEEVAYLRRINKELLDSQFQQDSLNFPWSGNLGHWYWDFQANKVTFNPMKAEALGYRKEDLPEYVSFQFFTEKIHPEDYEDVMEAMRKHLKGEIPIWEVKYRIKTLSGEYKTYYDRGKVTQRAEDNSPLFLSGIVFDITEDEHEKQKLLKQNKEWAQKVRLDQLTGLYNRSNILFNLGSLITDFKHTAKPLSMILLDIDNLKHQNALFGPLFGDEVIRKASQIIKESITEKDTAGNFEGGKFLILLPNTDLKHAHDLSNKIREKLHQVDFTEPAEITSSAGVAQYKSGDTVSEFFNRADYLLNQAKELGKNQSVIYPS